MEESALDDALELLGRLLAERGFGYEIVVVGGSALLLRGIIQRPTNDLDVLALILDGVYVSAQPLPSELENAARDVAMTLGLPLEWLNSVVSAQFQSDLPHNGLPPGFSERVETQTYGTLVVHVAGRLDLIYLKLYAAVDRPSPGKHIDDLRRLAPSRQELLDAADWVRTQDNIFLELPSLLANTLKDFGIDDAES